MPDLSQSSSQSWSKGILIIALFLPEASDYIASSAEETVSLVRSARESEFVLGLQQEARINQLPINVGIHEPGETGGKVKNTLIWIDGRGDITQRYQKIHLFDVSIKGSPVLKESRSVEKGTQIVPPFASPVGRIGLSICFDVSAGQLRFPEISLSLRRQGAQIITYPSAFTVPTGRAHWEILLRSRAIECQTYIVAAAQAGLHNGKRMSYGKSLIVSPWGEIVAQLPSVEEAESSSSSAVAPAIATADIDLDYVEKVRAQVPLVRRTDIYPEM
ncbi:Carbon-nitrogen hydrolase [Ascosphaera aggregata]|nr:Carbon-nitrogen hydrolase [Ascosphaera aggregata]